MQVDGFVELRDGFHCGRVVEVEGEGVGEVNLGDAEPCSPEGIEGFAAIIELDCEVAGVVVDAEAAQEKVGIAGLVQQSIKEGESVAGVLKVAQGLGFQSEVEVAPALSLERLDVACAGLQVGEERGLIGLEGLEGAGQGGNGTFHACGCQPGDNVEELVGVGEPFG